MVLMRNRLRRRLKLKSLLMSTLKNQSRKLPTIWTSKPRSKRPKPPKNRLKRRKMTSGGNLALVNLMKRQKRNPKLSHLQNGNKIRWVIPRPLKDKSQLMLTLSNLDENSSLTSGNSNLLRSIRRKCKEKGNPRRLPPKRKSWIKKSLRKRLRLILKPDRRLLTKNRQKRRQKMMTSGGNSALALTKRRLRRRLSSSDQLITPRLLRRRHLWMLTSNGKREKKPENS